VHLVIFDRVIYWMIYLTDFSYFPPKKFGEDVWSKLGKKCVFRNGMVSSIFL
jgi:hypothetical protein